MSRPASPARAMLALAGTELRLTARRGENVLVTIIVPAAVLVFFATAGVVPGIAGRPVDFLLPGSLALAVIASGLVNLGIATAYERNYGVLKRLGPQTEGRAEASDFIALPCSHPDCCAITYFVKEDNGVHRSIPKLVGIERLKDNLSIVRKAPTLPMQIPSAPWL